MITITLLFTCNFAVNTIIDGDIIYVIRIVCVVYRYKIKVFVRQVVRILTALANASHKLSIIRSVARVETITQNRMEGNTEVSDCTRINSRIL